MEGVKGLSVANACGGAPGAPGAMEAAKHRAQPWGRAGVLRDAFGNLFGAALVRSPGCVGHFLLLLGLWEELREDQGGSGAEGGAEAEMSGLRNQTRGRTDEAVTCN